MNKRIYYGFAMLLMLAVVGIAAAEDNASVADVVYTCPGQGAYFVDEDGDGRCDNFVDTDGNGINDNCGGYGAGNCGNGPRDGNGYRNGGAGGCNGSGCGEQRYNK